LVWVVLLLAGIVLVPVLASALGWPGGSEDEIGPIHAVAFCPGGQHLVTANQDGTVRLWDVTTGQEVRRYGRQRPAVTALAVSPDGKRILATSNYQGERRHGMILWDLASGQEVRRFLGHTGTVKGLAFSPDGRRVLSASGDRTVRVWDVENGREVQCLRGHQGDVNAVAVTPDGRYALSVGGDYWGGELHDPTVRVWDMGTGRPLRTFAGHTEAVDAVAVSPDGSLAASCGWDGAIRIWQVSSATELRCCEGPTRTKYTAVAFSPDGGRILSGSGHLDGLVQVWDARTGREVCRFPGPITGAHAVAFSPDGRLAASAHGYFGSRPPSRFNLLGSPEGCVVDGVARVWDVGRRKEVLRVGGPSVRE
jgi:WD40 repeat protein